MIKHLRLPFNGNSDHGDDDDDFFVVALKQLFAVEGILASVPKAFQLPGYMKARHEELLGLIQKDEEIYGQADLFDGHHLYNETDHLTLKGKIHRDNSNTWTTDFSDSKKIPTKLI